MIEEATIWDEGESFIEGGDCHFGMRESFTEGRGCCFGSRECFESVRRVVGKD